MFDVFYTGPKPNIFAFEKYADSIESADQQCKTKYFWYLHGDNDYNKFDFEYEPPPWEADHTHVWPSQWQRNGGTYLIPKGTKDHKWHWHDDGPTVYRSGSVEVFYLDFMNPGSQDQLKHLKTLWPNVKFTNTRYVDSHLNVFNRIANLAKDEYVWIISSICDYNTFPFNWHHAQWQEDMIHCFASGRQSRGDTFYFRPKSWFLQNAELEILDWFRVINYIEVPSVPRLPIPLKKYDGDNLVKAVQNYKFEHPYAVFTKDFWVNDLFYDPCVWSEKDRSIETFNRSNSTALVPRDAKSHIRTQLYDYPYINREETTQTKQYIADSAMDIVYISNGEPNEEKWHEILCQRSQRPVRWIRNVNGRAAAYKAAAKASESDWFFAVFAKLEVDSNFDWNWQPDYLQQPKHYIFHAKNILNGLEYGHMGVIAYNKRLVLETDIYGLDFTLSKDHTVIPVLSATAHFNSDPWMTWRTTFREVLKLKHFNNIAPSVDTAYRLKVWTTRANGANANWCLQGAADAVEYYDKVDGELEKLMCSFEWDWLRQYAKQLGRQF